jgi:PAS domain S-box-containing protein
MIPFPTTVGSNMANAFSYLSVGPLCMVALDPETDVAVHINEMFENTIGQMFKISGMKFSALATVGDQDRTLLEGAIEAVKSGKTDRSRARNVEMITLAGAGLPIKKHFDWTVGRSSEGNVILFGDPCTDQDMEQRAKDCELVDFFQNAPIALHWLSGDGIVLWANQRELEVLGYTAEEYIGQPIMKFCPDDEEIVLEIFKQLGSGNTIRDVPVRFRAKDGHVVDLLIDSNVKYDVNGKFEHTRCFIRDDTKRKISEARAKLLLDETKRSLKMLDNFMSRSLHHLRTPLHVLQCTLDIVSSNLSKLATRPGDAKLATEIFEESVSLMQQAGIHIDNAVVMIDDITDLARLDQGGVFNLNEEIIHLKDLGKQVLGMVSPPATSGVEVALELIGGGPAFLYTDANVLKKVLRHLLENAVHVTERGNITLKIAHEGDRCVFTIIDSGSGITIYEPPLGAGTNLPPIFQRYHQELVPEETQDFEQATTLRDKIEKGINSHRQNGIGIGLSLTYHLVRALGGELCYSSEPGLTQFWFSVPHALEQLASERIVRKGPQKREIPKTSGNRGSLDSAPLKKAHVIRESVVPDTLVSKSDIVCNGVISLYPPSVLVVEDVSTCAKLLCMSLRKANCSPTWVENGQLAIDHLRSSAPGMYSLILMDLRMPVMDGLTATKIIKEELKITIPIVALTGDAGEDTKSQCMEIGFDEYCNKPLKRADLLRVIKQYTGYNPGSM